MTFRRVVRFCRNNTVVPILILFVVASSIATPKFLTFKNISNLLLQSSVNGVMALGATYVIITGYRDLSVGMLMSLSAALVIKLQQQSLLLGIAVAVFVALLVGFINGFLVVKVGINTFIATLATMLGCRGAMYLYTDGRTLAGSVESFREFGAGSFLSIPNLVWAFFILMFIADFVLRRTVHGRNTYATGGNAEAASNAGINTARTAIINFMICSFGACLGGIFMAARTNSAYAAMGWPDTHFIVIVMVVLGGTKLAGGYGNIFYTLGGVLVLSIFENVFILLKVNAFFNPLITGLILIVTLYMDSVIKPSTEVIPAKGQKKKEINAKAL